MLGTARPRARRMPAAERRQQIIDVAMRMFAERGYGQTTTADIAQAAGISEPTIYRHFDNKQALYLAMLEHGLQEVLTAWCDMRDTAPDPLTSLTRISAWHQKQQKERPELLAHRFRAFGDCNDPVIAEFVRKGYLEIMGFVRDIFVRAKAAGQLAPDLDVEGPTLLFLALGALGDIGQQVGLEELAPKKLGAVPSIMRLWGKGEGS